MAELNLTSAVPHTDCGTGRQRGRIGWQIAAGILAAALLVATRCIKKLKGLHPIVFILASAVIGIVFSF